MKTTLSIQLITCIAGLLALSSCCSSSVDLIGEDEMKTALFAAKASEAAYLNEAQASRAMAPEGVTDFWTFDGSAGSVAGEEVEDTQGFICRSNGSVVVCFRGSAGLADWRTNLKISPSENSIVPAHEGFVSGWNSVSHEVKARLAVLRGKYGNENLLLCGHSLGGALGVYAALDLGESGHSISGIYTFGQPRVFSKTAVGDQRVKQLDKCLFRFVHGADSVPDLPMKSLGYEHIGSLRAIDREGLVNPRSDNLSPICFTFGESDPDAPDRADDKAVGAEVLNATDHKILRYVYAISENLRKRAVLE